MTTLRKSGSEDPRFQIVKKNTLNPKCISMGELYGEYNEMTQEWHDGLASTLMRAAVSPLDSESFKMYWGNMSPNDLRWVVFDGPIGALWIENMNTVLDDNMTLCLANGERIKLKAEMYQKATRDQLTGMFNRRYCFERLREEFSFAQRHGQPLSVVMFDVDHFKQVNDTYGHAAGDAVLQRIGRVVMELVRNEDVVCRYGGEEFVCILRGLTLDQGQLFADRVRRTIEAQVIASGEHVLRVTVSLGVAALRGMNFSNPEEMINEADAYLYVAKDGGRNQVASALTATS